MIESRQREVYYSPRRRRCFLTAKAAAHAEATARMRKWWPNESPEYESGFMTEPGWSFESDPRLLAIRDRLAKRYVRQLATPTGGGSDG